VDSRPLFKLWAIKDKFLISKQNNRVMGAMAKNWGKKATAPHSLCKKLGVSGTSYL